MMSESLPLVFNTSSYESLAELVISASSFEPGCLERRSFKDGETYLRLLSDVEGRDVILVTGTIHDAECLELFDMANVLVDSGAFSLKVLMPYFGYSTMERAVNRGEAVKAKYRARLLSRAIPRAPRGNHFYLLDLHSEGLPHYFEEGVHTKHVYAKDLVKNACQSLCNQLGIEWRNFVLASTDAGRTKWVESLAHDIEVPVAFAYKSRSGFDQVLSLGVSGPVEGKVVIIYDDMIRTGGSLLQAAKAYREKGASMLAAVATHGVLPGESLKKIKDSGLLQQIVVTDSHPASRALESEFLQVQSVSDLMVRALKNEATSID